MGEGARVAHTAVPQRGRAGQTALLPHVHGWRVPVATVAVPSRQREHEGFEGPRRAVPRSRGRDVRARGMETVRGVQARHHQPQGASHVSHTRPARRLRRRPFFPLASYRGFIFLGTADAGRASRRRPSRSRVGFEPASMTTPCRTHSGMARRALSGRSPASHEAIWAHPSADTTFTGQPRHLPRKTNSRVPSSSHQHPTYPGFDQDGVAQRAARVQRRHQRRHVGLLTVRGDKRDHVEGWRLRPRR